MEAKTITEQHRGRQRRMKLIKGHGRIWKVPERVHFNNTNARQKQAFSVVGYRTPKQGEYYLSGAIVSGYQAPNDLSTKYLIVKPINPKRS